MLLICHRRTASPAPKANEGLVKAKFYAELAKAKNAPALGVKVNVVFGTWSERLASVTGKLTDKLFAFHIAILFNLCSWGTSSIAIIR